MVSILSLNTKQQTQDHETSKTPQVRHPVTPSLQRRQHTAGITVQRNATAARQEARRKMDNQQRHFGFVVRKVVSQYEKRTCAQPFRREATHKPELHTYRTISLLSHCPSKMLGQLDSSDRGRKTYRTQSALTISTPAPGERILPTDDNAVCKHHLPGTAVGLERAIRSWSLTEKRPSECVSTSQLKHVKINTSGDLYNNTQRGCTRTARSSYRGSRPLLFA
jgi:hypothetical protein